MKRKLYSACVKYGCYQGLAILAETTFLFLKQSFFLLPICLYSDPKDIFIKMMVYVTEKWFSNLLHENALLRKGRIV